jgi:hypothetical protein
MISRTLLCLFIMAAPLGLAVAEMDAELNDLSVSNALGGPKVLDAIRTSPTITARRVDQKTARDRSAAEPPAPPTPPAQLIALGEPFALPDELAQKLRKTLTSGKTYLGVPKRCPFRANVLLKFSTAGSAPVDLVLCFGCGELQVWQNEEFLAFSPFDNGYRELADFAKQAFPGDSYLTTISDEAFRERWLENQEP